MAAYPRRESDINFISVVLSHETTLVTPVPFAAVACELERSCVEDVDLISLLYLEKLN